MKDEKMEVPGMDAVESVGANSPNDRARTQVGTTDPYRYCSQAPHVPNPDNMNAEKGGY